jgi:hypothetical protein
MTVAIKETIEMTKPLGKNQRISKKLHAHAILSADFQANGMSREDASRVAFDIVRDMTDAKLRRICDPVTGYREAAG